MGIMDGDTHTGNESPAAEAEESGGMFDPAEMLREMYVQEAMGKEAPVKARQEPEEPAEEEESPEPEAPETEEESPEEEETDEPEAELDVKNPAALAKAAEEMRGRLQEQSAVLKELKDLLGVKSRKEIPDALKARLDSAAEEPLPVTLPTPERPLANVTNEAGIATEAEHYQSLLEWCAQNPDGGECPLYKNGENEPLEVTPEWVKHRMELSKRVLFPQKQKDGSIRPSLLEQRRTQLQALRADSKAAAAVFPFFADAAPANAPEHVKKAHAQQRGVLGTMVRDITAEVPEITHYSGAASLLGDAAVGRLIRQHGFAAAVKDGRVILNALTSAPPVPKAPVKKAPPVTRESATPPPVRKAGDPFDEKIAAAYASGDIEAANRLEMQRLYAAAGR